MKKVITYGTYDLFHRGHDNLLRRAKALGDYLIVGVTSDNFDRSRGKLLVRQSAAERVEAVRATGYADEIILEEYEGQKIDDIKKYGVDIFTLGSDWKGKFDYLSEYCQVIYLPRTEGVSSTTIRNQDGTLRIGIIGCASFLDKFLDESRYISGVDIPAYYFENPEDKPSEKLAELKRCGSSEELLEQVDAAYVVSSLKERAGFIRQAMKKGTHVLCESPLSMRSQETRTLCQEARDHGLVLFEALKTAYSLAFQRLVLLLKGGVIGVVKCVEATCTSLQSRASWNGSVEAGGGSITTWGPYAFLPALKILGCGYRSCSFATYRDKNNGVDIYTRVQLLYDTAEAILKVGSGVKSEGDMVISGTQGYIYVPAPWWKMDYFEVRKEDSRENKRYFYQFEGEGIRYELAEFVRSVRTHIYSGQLSSDESAAISGLIERFYKGENVTYI